MVDLKKILSVAYSNIKYVKISFSYKVFDAHNFLHS